MLKNHIKHMIQIVKKKKPNSQKVKRLREANNLSQEELLENMKSNDIIINCIGIIPQKYKFLSQDYFSSQYRYSLDKVHKGTFYLFLLLRS